MLTSNDTIKVNHSQAVPIRWKIADTTTQNKTLHLPTTQSGQRHGVFIHITSLTASGRAKIVSYMHPSCPSYIFRSESAFPFVLWCWSCLDRLDDFLKGEKTMQKNSPPIIQAPKISVLHCRRRKQTSPCVILSCECSKTPPTAASSNCLHAAVSSRLSLFHMSLPQGTRTESRKWTRRSPSSYTTVITCRLPSRL